MNASLSFGRRHPLHAMRARLELEVRERALADHAADVRLVAAVLAGTLRQHFDAPALLVGVARIHAKQIAGEDRCLVATGARAHFKIDVAVVACILRQQQLRELFFLALEPCVEAAQLFAAELAQLVVRAFSHFLRGDPLGEQLQVRAIARDDGIEAGILHRQLAELVVVRDHAGIREQMAHFLEPLRELLQFSANRIFHSALSGTSSARAASSTSLSPRSAASRSRWLGPCSKRLVSVAARKSMTSCGSRPAASMRRACSTV